MISLRLFIAVMTVTTVWLSFIPYSIFLYRIRSSRGPKQAEENEPPQVKRSVATKRWDLLGIQSEEDTAVESPTSTSEIMSPIPLSLWRCTEQLQIDHNQNCVNVSEDVLLKNNSNLNFECEQELRPTTFITKFIAFSGKFSITDLSADSATESVKSFSAEVYYQVKKTKHLIVQLEYNSGTPDRRMFSSVLPYLKSEKVKVRFAGSVHAPIRFCLHDMVGILQPSYILTAPEPNPVENIMSDFPFSKYPPTLIQIVGHHGLSFLRDQESSCLNIINRPSLIRDSRFIAFFMRVAILKQQKFSVRARISVQRRVQDANVSFLLMFQKGIEPNIKKSFLLGEYSKVLETSTHEKPFAKGADVLELAGTGSFSFINLFLRVELQNNLKFNENEQLVSLCHSFLSVSPKS